MGAIKLDVRLLMLHASLYTDMDDSFILGSENRKKRYNTREVHKFYEEQNKQIAAYLKVRNYRPAVSITYSCFH